MWTPSSPGDLRACPIFRSRLDISTIFHTYIHHYDNNDHELFNLKTDIGETVNLYRTHPARAVRLMAWLKATDAQLPRLYVDIPAEELPGRKRTAQGP